jgi:hypothetical protein
MADTYPIWIVPRGQFVTADGARWDLDAEATDPGALRFRWDDVVSSLSRWVAEKRPAVLMEHGADAVDHVATWGHVVEAFELTAEEAVAAGLDMRTPTDALYGRVSPSDDLWDLRASGRVGLGSPGLRASYVDDHGERWPLVLTEWSHTYNPRIKDRQPLPSSLLSAQLSDEVSLMEDEIVEQVAEQVAEAAAEAPDLAAAVAALVESHAALVESHAALTARVEALEAAGGQAADEPADEEPPADEEAAQMRDVRRVVVAELSARAKVDQAFRERVIAPEHRAFLSDLATSNPARFDRTVALAPKRTQAKRAALADGRPSEDLDTHARRLRKEKGIPYDKALEAALSERGGVR